MGYLELQGTDWRRITGALESSFRLSELERLVAQQFPRIDREVAWGRGIADVVFEIADTANRHGVLDQLLVATTQERQFRPDLRSLVLYYSQSPGWLASFESNGLDVGNALERLTITGDPFVDTGLLARWIVRVERQVCQVRCGPEHGTGFLVAPDLVLTCYHVVVRHLEGGVGASDVKVHFDYRRTAPNVEPPSTGPWLDIDPDWEIPHAPYSQADITLKGDPKESELDFALLKLKLPAGRERPEGEDAERGWVDLSSDPHLPEEQAPILIVQHPRRDDTPPPQMPLQIAFATPGFETLNSNKTRIAYTPSTRKGSSGSPVFDGTLDPVALHHNRGQINPNAKDLVKNNRGIPLGKIRVALDEDVRAMLISPPDGS